MHARLSFRPPGLARTRGVPGGAAPHGTARRAARAVRLVTAIALAIAAGGLAAQAYPNRSLRMVVPFPAGGGTDILARTVGQALGDALGQSIVIDNRPGASTIIGAEIVARSAPDGYTLLLAPVTTLAINPAGYAKLPYDVVRDFAPIARITSNYQVLAARLEFPASTLPELIALAKARPGTITYGSTGVGGPSHFGGAMLESLTGIRMLHIPYKGNAQVLADLVGGQVDLHVVGPASVQSFVKAGKVKLIAAGAPRRLANFPDLPTVAEYGYSGYTTGAWYVMVTRAGTPRPIIDRLNREINAALAQAAVKATLDKDGFLIDAPSSPEESAAFIAAEMTRWTKVVRDAGVKFE